MEELQRELARQEKIEVNNRVLEDLKNFHRKGTKKIKDPRKMLPQKHRNVIYDGAHLFEREYREKINRQGYLRLLKHVQDSGFTLRQIKNGCSTLFDKDCMTQNYTNPHLTKDHLKKEFINYLDNAKPDRYWDEIEKGMKEQQSINDFNNSALLNKSSISMESDSLESVNSSPLGRANLQNQGQ